MNAEPSKTFIVELRRDRPIFTDHTYPGVSVNAYAVAGDGPMADGRGLLWVEIVPENVGAVIAEIIPAPTYRDHIASLTREIAA